jgi:tetratricopeptide (TPR) repeat protein
VRIRFGIIGHIGDAYFALKEYKEAIPWMQSASNHAAELLAADPLDSRTRFDLHLDEMRLGDTYARMGDKQHAREHYSRVLQLLAFLRAREPGNVIYQDHQREAESKLAALR